MAEKKDRDAALAQLYSNKPDDAFFAQFGTRVSARVFLVFFSSRVDTPV